jgi:hypothetical protein
MKVLLERIRRAAKRYTQIVFITYFKALIIRSTLI